MIDVIRLSRLAEMRLKAIGIHAGLVYNLQSHCLTGAHMPTEVIRAQMSHAVVAATL